MWKWTNGLFFIWGILSSVMLGERGEAQLYTPGNSSDYDLVDTIRKLARQIIHNQDFVQERFRSDGTSGIKQIRHSNSGTRPYHSPTHTGMTTAGIHNHYQDMLTMGMGEIIAVMNGIEFRTRHNDFRLYMPHRTSSKMDATEYIPFPDVPPEVLNKPTVQEQVDEMREWFKAFKLQDATLRNYPKYFKPVLCYLEAGWFVDHPTIDESKWSVRHFIDANTWAELSDEIRFLSYTGERKGNENLAYLPKVLMGLKEDGITPVFAQWNYRILCHPLKNDLPFNRLRLIDELDVRVPYKLSLAKLFETAKARFQLNLKDTDKWKDQHYKHGLLDDLFYEIPGMDNYPAKIKEDTYGEDYSQYKPGNPPLNAGYYHRWYKCSKSWRSRGFSDDSLFVAFNTQNESMAMPLNDCSGTGSTRTCVTYHKRVTYAIPLEIDYMTPLSKWNPYNIVFKGNPNSPYDKSVTENGRNGGLTKDKAFNGVHERSFYWTPSEFYTGELVGKGNYDKKNEDRGVLDKNGILRVVRPSGHYIVLPEIKGINGRVRQRFPIFPVHGEGSTIWKEVEALKQVIFNEKKKYDFIYNDYP